LFHQDAVLMFAVHIRSRRRGRLGFGKRQRSGPKHLDAATEDFSQAFSLLGAALTSATYARG
jgi:hypothetical protein